VRLTDKVRCNAIRDTKWDAQTGRCSKISYRESKKPDDPNRRKKENSEKNNDPITDDSVAQIFERNPGKEKDLKQ